MANQKKDKAPPPEIDDLLARKNAEATLIARAWNDRAFRKELLANPKATIEKAVGAKLPKGAKVTIHEEGPGEYHYVLPAAPAASGELSDAELESVAGGKHKTHFHIHKKKKNCHGKAGGAVISGIGRDEGHTVFWDAD